MKIRACRRLLGLRCENEIGMEKARAYMVWEICVRRIKVKTGNYGKVNETEMEKKREHI